MIKNLESFVNGHKGRTPSQIGKVIVNSSDANRYVYIILGRSGPTGKTWLYNFLRESGFNVFEISESTRNDVKYTKNFNSVHIGGHDNSVVIILNEPIVVSPTGNKLF